MVGTWRSWVCGRFWWIFFSTAFFVLGLSILLLVASAAIVGISVPFDVNGNAIAAAVSAVPIPAAIWLFGATISVLGLRRRTV